MSLTYFDYMATTPVDPKVIEVMVSCLGIDSNFANPASQHLLGQNALNAVDMAREQVATAINAQAQEVIWTSGATESDNLAIKGAAFFYKRNGNHLITLQSEHKAVLDCFSVLERQGYRVTYLKPLANGLIDMDALKEALCDETILVSVMHVNNEIGVIQPISEIANLLKDKGIIFHVDAAQSMGKIVVDVKQMGADLISFSAHKVYGPKGVGALYIRSKPRVRLEAQIHGGGHERGYRSGTLATHQLVGMGMAFELAAKQVSKESKRIRGFFDKILAGIECLGGVHVNGCQSQRAFNNLSLSFEGVDGEALLYALSDICVSSTSACASASIEPSYVIKSLGVSDALAHSTIRLSLGRFTTEADVDKAIKLIIDQVTRLRALYEL